MKRGLILLVGLILFMSFASADIIINQQPKAVYNLGDLVEVPATIKATKDTIGNFQMDLICNGPIINFYKNGLKLASGEEKKFDSSVVLIKENIGTIKGKCKIKASLGEEFVLTNEFQISEIIKVNLDTEKKEFDPGTYVLIEGSAVKENSKDVEGFVEIEFSSIQISTNTNESNETTTTTSMLLTDAVSNGFFSVNISLAEDMKAGKHPIKLTIYEKDPNGERTNTGFANYEIVIKQKPTSLEILFENSEIDPGTNLKVKSIIHDQTGENIASTVIMTIKKANNEILEQIEKQTGDFLEFPIARNEPPSEWKVVAVSNKLTSETTFKIKEKKDINVEIINKTLILTNTGNVFYNESLLVKIGNKSLNINVSLDIDEDQKYVLSAPKGEYQVDVITNDGENRISKSVFLTGKAIDVKEASSKVMTLVRYPIIWIFVIAIMGFVGFIIFKKGYKKTFLGYIHSKKKDENRLIPTKKSPLINAKNKAELSLSIKGDKQNVSLVCLNIKNFNEIGSTKSNAKETLQNIIDLAEKEKAFTYESQEHLFFILVPTKTRTFKNETTAVEIAQKAETILIGYNKLAKQKIDFGISLNYGTIIAKQENNFLKFMSMGTLITTAKKISSLADKEIFLSEKIKERVTANIKTEKHDKGKIPVYTIKEIKNREEHKKFLRSFLDRIERKN